MGFIERVGHTASVLDLSGKATIAAAQPSSLVSNKYTMASTQGIIDILGSQGWLPVGYNEKKARRVENSGKQLHTVVLSNPQFDGGSTLPRIVVKNSHDGGSSHQLLSGVFERICANGLVVGNSAADVRIRHLSLTEEKIIEGLKVCIESLSKAFQITEKMKSMQLDKTQQLEFAQDVIEMAWDGSQYSILPTQLLWNHRRDQREPTLWNTFNTVQEHVIRGGVRQQRADGSRISSRAVKSIDRSIELNRSMWDIAEKRMASWT